MQKVLAKYKGMAKKKKNGGFTLVELIIVIAIIAVLVAILAPQYLQYVEKSKVAADNSTADQILSAAKVAASDEDTSLVANGTYTIIWQNADGGKSSTVTISASPSGTDITNLQNALCSALGISPSANPATLANGTVIKSAKYKAEKYTVQISVAGDGSTSLTTNWA